MRLHTPLLFAGLLVLSGSPLSAAPVTGHWLTYKSKAMVRITQCGTGLCGQIVWLKKGLDSRGRPVQDLRNRSANLRGRQVLGLTTFSGLKPSGAKSWSGLMYNPDDGRTYNGSLTLTGRSKILIKACRVGGSACGERTWLRAQQNAQK